MSGYEALRSTAAWIDLSNRGKIRVTGEDRARLMHAMSTNDIQHLSSGDGVYAFFLTAVGRIIADAYIYNLGESLFLDTEPEAAIKLAEHLDKYVIADDATLENETEQWACIGVEGPRALQLAPQIGISVAEAPYAVSDYQNGFTTHVSSTGPVGFRVFVPIASKSMLLEQLETKIVPQADAAEARVVRIENGIPRYGDEISERYLVQETRQMHAVHSNKGCYMGQEIVERVRSRGQVHRVLMPVRIHGITAPRPGTKLNAGAAAAGEVASAEFSPVLGEVVGLAYVRTEAADVRPELMVAGTDPPITATII